LALVDNHGSKEHRCRFKLIKQLIEPDRNQPSLLQRYDLAPDGRDPRESIRTDCVEVMQRHRELSDFSSSEAHA
jgi:hypothetical protein